MSQHLVLFAVLLLVAIHSVHAYVPALPTNDTSMLTHDSMNATQSSKLHLQWNSNWFVLLSIIGTWSKSHKDCSSLWSLWNDVSYQLAGSNSTGITQVYVVRVIEVIFGLIALVGCTCAYLGGIYE